MISLDSWSPGNVLDLAVLGTVCEHPLSTTEIVGVVKRVGGARFQPTTDLIASRLATHARAGLLAPMPGQVAGNLCWRASEAGRAHLRRLLLMRNGAPGDALAGLCACLKVCFLEMLDPEARGEVIEDLLSAHRHELGRARTALERCPRRSPFVHRYLAREVERWEAELSWLEALHLLATGRAAA